MTQSKALGRVDPPWKIQERRCRRKAHRLGLRVERHMWSSYRAGASMGAAYQVVDPATATVLAGDVSTGDGMTLDEIEAFLGSQAAVR